MDADEKRRHQNREHMRAWRARNPDKVRAAYEASRESLKERAAAWQKANPDRTAAKTRRYRARHPDRVKAQNDRARRENPALYAHHAMLRKARKLQATPPWADLVEIRAIYEATPEGHHVDHVIPLVHPLVCGLHCAANLQYLPARENLKKRNTWTP